jgi:hypothetical protein
MDYLSDHMLLLGPFLSVRLVALALIVLSLCCGTWCLCNLLAITWKALHTRRRQLRGENNISRRS